MKHSGISRETFIQFAKILRLFFGYPAISILNYDQQVRGTNKGRVKNVHGMPLEHETRLHPSIQLQQAIVETYRLVLRAMR